jgi:hypothetical protein
MLFEILVLRDDAQVCLTLDCVAFDRIVASHTIRMQYAIQQFKHRRETHKKRFR